MSLQVGRREQYLELVPRPARPETTAPARQLATCGASEPRVARAADVRFSPPRPDPTRFDAPSARPWFQLSLQDQAPPDGHETRPPGGSVALSGADAGQ